ncbi:MAG: hypothetical protein LIP12_00180 [Clostridiales bacterium]|nr:hypothetical protein [Clostridiales bacterium]
MGGRGSSSGLIPPGKQPTKDRMGFSDTDTADFHELYNGRNYYNQQNFDIDTEMALADYVNPNATAGSLYSPSQQLNYALKNGDTLTANQQFMLDSMQAGMHNIGYNVKLTRYARVDFMQMLGVPNFSNMSEAQLQKALVGTSYQERGFLSTSHNNFKNAPNGGAPFTDKAVKVVYKAPANTQALMAPNGGGGQLGEVVIDSNRPNQWYDITGVHFTGKRGRSGSQYYNQVEFEVTVRPG